MAGQNHGTGAARQKALDDLIKAMQPHAAELFMLMEPGQTVQFDLTFPRSIIVPGQSPVSHGKLIVTRPNWMLGVNATVK